MLELIVAEQWLTARAVVGFFPAHSVGDDIVVFNAKAQRGKDAEILTSIR
jgi:5-methyltetrahydrofolate--homocysteine methyltransferase